MTALPAADFFNGAITNAEAKDAQDEILAVIRELLGGEARSELTIASGSITPTGAVHTVDTESDAGSDNLDFIAQTNHPETRFLAIRAEDPTRAVVVRHNITGTGKILLADAVNLTLTGADQWLLLMRDDTTWREMRFVQAAGETRAGIVELATTAEAAAGADTARAVTAAGLQAGLNAKLENFVCIVTGPTVAPAAGADKFVFPMPYAFNVTAVYAELLTEQTSGNIVTVDINEGASTILTTKLTIDNGETTSRTAVAAAVIGGAGPAIAAGAMMRIDVDQVGDGTARGLVVTLVGNRV
jgi:hypothetical protein